MTLLDDRLQRLQATARDYASEFRDHALALDRDPGDMRPFMDLAGVRWMAQAIVPPEFAETPLRLGPYRYDGMECLERVVGMEQLAYGDAGLALASPGASMSGVVVDQLGSPAHKEAYFGRIVSEPTWTFFAVTEPARGSDAGALETSLTEHDDAWRLDGCKRYIGNGARAAIGVAFVRTRPGPLGIEVALVDTRAPGFSAQPLEMIGLRGAQISELRFDAMVVPDDAILGRELPATRRGVWGAVMTFNRLRPAVAAAALGVAQAAFDYVRGERREWRCGELDRLEDLEVALAGTRELVYRAALEVERAPARGALASAAKVHAVRLAEHSTRTAAALLGPGSLFEHPLVEKWLRDARGFEFMEGTTNIQKLNVFAGVRKGLLAHA